VIEQENQQPLFFSIYVVIAHIEKVHLLISCQWPWWFSMFT